MTKTAISTPLELIQCKIDRVDTDISRLQDWIEHFDSATTPYSTLGSWTTDLASKIEVIQTLRILRRDLRDLVASSTGEIHLPSIKSINA